MENTPQKILLRKYLEENDIARVHIDSFNNFIRFGMQKVVDENKEVEPSVLPPNIDEFKIKFGKISVGKPEVIEADGSRRLIYPIEARIRKIDYVAPVTLEISTVINDIEKEKTTVTVGQIPIMLKSKNCNLYGLERDQLIEVGEDPDDPGGYFIINGTEKVIVMIEDLAPSNFNVEKASVGPSRYVGKLISRAGALTIPHTLEQLRDGIFYLTFGRIKRIPVFVIIKALGVTKDAEIIKMVNAPVDSEVYLNLYEFVDLTTPEDALDYIAKKLGLTQSREVRIERVQNLLHRFLLPHVGTTPYENTWKAFQLAKMVKKFIMVSNGLIGEDDKDHYANKRLSAAGEALETLFRTEFRIFINDMLYNFQRIVKRGKLPNIRMIVRENLITQRMKSAMATGTWVGGRTGVSQRILRNNFLDLVSHLQRVVSPLSNSQENFEARNLHPTHLGRLCPTETPEGANIGLRKNLAMIAKLSHSYDETKIIEKLTALGLNVKIPIHKGE